MKDFRSQGTNKTSLAEQQYKKKNAHFSLVPSESCEHKESEITKLGKEKTFPSKWTA